MGRTKQDQARSQALRAGQLSGEIKAELQGGRNSSEAQGTCLPTEEVLVAVRLVIRIMQKNVKCKLRPT